MGGRSARSGDGHDQGARQVTGRPGAAVDRPGLHAGGAVPVAMEGRGSAATEGFYLQVQRAAGNKAVKKMLAGPGRSRRGGGGGSTPASGEPPVTGRDSELSFEFDGQEFTFSGIDRQNWKKARQRGEGVSLEEPATTDVDEPQAVGQQGIPPEEALRRALDPENRQLLVSVENRVGKGTRTELPSPAKGAVSPLSEPVSVLDNPTAVFTRRFGEVQELREIFLEARAKYAGRPGLRPVDMKNLINGEVRRLIAEGSSDAAQRVRTALEAVGFDPKGIKAVRADSGTVSTGAPQAPAEVVAPVPGPAGGPLAAPAGTVPKGGGLAGTAGRVAEHLGKGAAVFGSLLGGWEVGGGIDQLLHGEVGAGSVDVAEGSANLALTIGTTAAVKSGALVAEGGAAAGAVGLGAGMAAAGGVGLAAESGRAALSGEKTPVEVADAYYGTHVGDVAQYVDWVMRKLPAPLYEKYRHDDDFVHELYRRLFL